MQTSAGIKYGVARIRPDIKGLVITEGRGYIGGAMWIPLIDVVENS